MKVKIDANADGLVFYCAECGEMLQHEHGNRGPELRHPGRVEKWRGFWGGWETKDVTCRFKGLTFIWPFEQELQEAPF